MSNLLRFETDLTDWKYLKFIVTRIFCFNWIQIGALWRGEEMIKGARVLRFWERNPMGKALFVNLPRRECIMRSIAAHCFILVSLSFITCVPTVLALEPNPQCVKDAQDEFAQCKANCRDKFSADKDLCRRVSHDCADNCRSIHSACVEDPLDAFDNCKDSCNDNLQDAKEDCRHQFGEGTLERHQCIDVAQTAAFQCRDNCREGLSGTLKQCNKDLRSCLKACPPPPTH
jgi:hypothetical protein